MLLLEPQMNRTAIGIGVTDSVVAGSNLKAPANVVPPTLALMFASMGTDVTISDLGTWIGNPPPSASAYQWRLDGIDIMGETADHYEVTGLESIGAILTCNVTFSNSEGSASEPSSECVIIA